MCVPGCEEVVRANLSRRNFVKNLALGGAAAVMSSGCQSAERQKSPEREESAAADGRGDTSFPAFQRVVDLTHTYSSRFPHYRGGGSRVEMKVEATTEANGWNVNTWTIDEHAGTHIDSPFHRNGDGMRVHEIPARDLVLPLAVVDIREAARKNADAKLTLSDLKRWEAANGPIPDCCCLALMSGWDAHVTSERFIGFDDERVRHFPGFDLEAIQFVVEERNAVAIASDTASLDYGPTTDYPVHTLWLGTDRWGLENVANLGDVPATGATIVCGAPKIDPASGGPSRVFALV